MSSPNRHEGSATAAIRNPSTWWPTSVVPLVERASRTTDSAMTATHTYWLRLRCSRSTSRDRMRTTATPLAMMGWTTVTGASIRDRTWKPRPHSISANPQSQRGEDSRVRAMETARRPLMAGSCPSACFSTIRPEL